MNSGKNKIVGNLDGKSGLFEKGIYNEIMGKPLIRELRDDISNDRYKSKDTMYKWRGLKIKILNTANHGCGVPDAAIDVGLDFFERIIDDCVNGYVEIMKKGAIGIDMDYFSRTLNGCIKEYENLLNMKMNKYQYQDGNVVCIDRDDRTVKNFNDTILRGLKLDIILLPLSNMFYRTNSL